MTYEHEIPNIQTVVNQIMDGKLLEVNKWSYYGRRKLINNELIRLNLFSFQVAEHLFTLEESAKESL